LKNEHLSGVVALLELLMEAKDRKPEYGLRFLITVSGVGLACWLEKKQTKTTKVGGYFGFNFFGERRTFYLTGIDP
jgi:aminopeptidase-like protein